MTDKNDFHTTTDLELFNALEDGEYSSQTQETALALASELRGRASDANGILPRTIIDIADRYEGDVQRASRALGVVSSALTQELPIDGQIDDDEAELVEDILEILDGLEIPHVEMTRLAEILGVNIEFGGRLALGTIEQLLGDLPDDILELLRADESEAISEKRGLEGYVNSDEFASDSLNPEDDIPLESEQTEDELLTPEFGAIIDSIDSILSEYELTGLDLEKAATFFSISLDSEDDFADLLRRLEDITDNELEELKFATDAEITQFDEGINYKEAVANILRRRSLVDEEDEIDEADDSIAGDKSQTLVSDSGEEFEI